MSKIEIEEHMNTDTWHAFPSVQGGKTKEKRKLFV